MHDLKLITRRLDPSLGEIWLSASDPFTGKLMGPRCRYASTVEIAYHFQPLPRNESPHTKRALIPEPSLWEPTTPFLYEGYATLADQSKIPLCVGLRTLQLNPLGLRLNGRNLELKGGYCSTVGEAEMTTLRQSGWNALACRVSDENHHVWELADRIGMFVIGILERTPEALALARGLKSRPSSLAWLLEGWHDLTDPGSLQGVPGKEPFLGVSKVEGELPEWVQFVTEPHPAKPCLTLAETD